MRRMKRPTSRGGAGVGVVQIEAETAGHDYPMCRIPGTMGGIVAIMPSDREGPGGTIKRGFGCHAHDPDERAG